MQTKTLYVNLPRVQQKLVIGIGLNNCLIEEISERRYSNVIVFADKNVIRYFSELIHLIDPIKVVEFDANERVKDVIALAGTINQCMGIGLNRKSCILAIGGGTLGDLAGFIASIYMRGIDMISIPTTLMSQCDSVMQKVAISHENAKNIIGSFYSPALTICDVDYLNTLESKQISEGFAEIIKHALIDSHDFCEYLLNILNNGMAQWRLFPWENIIYRSLEVKSRLVEGDPYDRVGKHKGLSYGHTFANAFEALSGFSLSHGVAINLGMRVAGLVSNYLGYLSSADLDLQNKLLDSANLLDKLPSNINIDEIIGILKNDKISNNHEISLVLLKRIGYFTVERNVDQKLVERALNEIM